MSDWKRASKRPLGDFQQIGTLFQENEISDDLWEELEEALIVADVGMDTTLALVESTRARVEAGKTSGRQAMPI